MRPPPRADSREHPGSEAELVTHCWSLLDNIFTYVAVLDLDGRVLRVNRAALQAVGCTEADVVGRAFWDTPWWATSEEVRAELRRAIARARDGHACRFEALHPLAAGGTIHVDFMISPLRDAEGRVRCLVPCAVDVTPRVEAEAALRRSEALLARAGRIARLGAWRWDLATEVFEASEMVAEMLDIPPAWLPLTHERYESLVLPEERAARRMTLEAVLRDGGEYCTSYGVRTPLGRTVRLEVHGELVRDGQGRPTGLIGTMQDVTEQHRITSEMRRSKQLLEAVLDNIPDVVWLKDGRSRLLAVNQAYADLVGRPRETLLGLTDLDFFPPAFGAKNVAEDRRVMTTGLPLVIEDVVPRGDTRRIFETVKTPIRDESGAVIGTVGSAREITERKRAEEAFRFQADLLEAVQQAVVATGLDGEVRFWSRSAEAMFGWTSAEALGRPVRELIGTAPDPAEERRVGTCIVRGEPWASEIRGSDRHGSPRRVSITGSPLRDHEGRLTGTVAIGTDVGPQRTLEEQLLQAQKMEAVGRLAGGIAHDFNNVLTAVGTHAELLLADLRPEDPIRPDVQEIRDAVERAAQLTRQLLAFSRRQVLQPRQLDLGEVVTALERMLRRLIGEDIRLEIRCDDALPPVFADPGQMEQVVLNLVVNSRDAMPRGGELTIETRATTLGAAELHGESGAAPGAYVGLVVRDTGCGIAPEVLPRIFEPFFTTKGRTQGTGLGLSTVYGIVQQSGGLVRVHSAPGEGTAFTVFLPCAAAAGAPAVVPRAPGVAVPVPRGTEMILLVEDEEEVRAVVARTLERHGYRVVAARNGEEALPIYEAMGAAIRLVLTDLVMPGMSGRDLMERLLGRGHHPRVLFMSGYTEDPRITVLDPAPGTAFLQKPFTVAALARAVRQLLDG